MLRAGVPLPAQPAGPRDLGERDMRLGRRDLFHASLALAPPALANPARARTTDLVAACDTALGPAIKRVAAAYTARTGVEIRLFPASPNLLLPQLARDVQNDVLITQVSILEQAGRTGLLAADATRAGPWRTRLVLAAPRGTGGSDGGPIAVPDMTPAFPWDSRAILAGIGLQQAITLGAIDTRGVAFLLTSGAARAGLLYLTEMQAEPGLEVVTEIPDAVSPPLAVGAAISHGASRPNPGAFVAFLNSGEAAELLRANGLETAA
jgi:molybdate transport system substrate-binding protein